jgi:predicted NUDIX family phosphoesterase
MGSRVRVSTVNTLCLYGRHKNEEGKVHLLAGRFFAFAIQHRSLSKRKELLDMKLINAEKVQSLHTLEIHRFITNYIYIYIYIHTHTHTRKQQPSS